MGKGSQPHRSRTGRKARRAVGLGHSRAGRPRKDGARYDNGRLKPAGPNERVLTGRRALLGDPEARPAELKAAENPLDLMLARGWLSRDLHEAGRAFAALHARARLSLPAIRTSRLELRGRTAPEAGDPVALWRLNEIWSGLANEQRSVLIDVCVLEAWPPWLVTAATTVEQALRAALLEGPRKRSLEIALTRTAEIIRRPTPAGLRAGSDLSQFVAWMTAG